MWKRFQSNTQNKPDTISIEKQGNPETSDLGVTKKVFAIDFQIDSKYYDLNNKEQEEKCIDCLPGSGDWGYFFFEEIGPCYGLIDGSASTTQGRPRNIRFI